MPLTQTPFGFEWTNDNTDLGVTYRGHELRHFVTDEDDEGWTVYNPHTGFYTEVETYARGKGMVDRIMAARVTSLRNQIEAIEATRKNKNNDHKIND